MYDAEFIVVGAGPAGSSCAALLARAKRDVLLLDQATFPRDKACGEYLSPGAVQILAAQFPSVHALLHPVPGLRVRTEGGALLEAPFPENQQAASARRSELDAALLREPCHAGARFISGARLNHVAPDNTGVTASGRHGSRGRTWRGAWLVAADGYHSRVVRSLGWDRPSRRKRAAWVRHADEAPDSPFVELFAGRWIVGVGPLGTSANLCVVADDRAGPLAGELRNEDALAAAPAARTLQAAVAGDHGLTTDCAPRRSRFAARERILVIGDAARFEDPFSGEGIYLALAGAELAAEALLHRGSADPCKGYDRARRTELEGRYRLSAVIRELLARPAFRELSVGALARSPELASLFLRTIADLEPPDGVLNARFAVRLLSSAFGLLVEGRDHAPGK